MVCFSDLSMELNLHVLLSRHILGSSTEVHLTYGCQQLTTKIMDSSSMGRLVPWQRDAEKCRESGEWGGAIADIEFCKILIQKKPSGVLLTHI